MGKTQCQYRLEGVTDHGVILRPSQKGEPLYPCEGGGIREAILNRAGPYFTCSMTAGPRWTWPIR